MIGKLTRNHDFRRHHDDFVGDARETDDRTAELNTTLRILKRLLHGGLRDTDRSRGSLNARRFESLHELFEAEAFDPAEQILGLHLEAVEGDFVLLHAAIAEHFNLGSAHSLCWKRALVIATRLFGEKHRETAMPGFV